ncbi:J domain-containing protein [Arthrobacter sp. A2-55]|uniref:J domain-containing protein n=1 Tax=Arthrobacter sp. A2-55 TaxID=2897337 RepID=UPI0021CD2ABE|nr:J domain-containing protein [Arthrobacter sp. A2-55]MCU6482150.1 J domain-containing protein [Arthrobacter sp. A2-55]
MVGSPDFYAVLGLEPDASGAEIRRAYRSLLRSHHPDTRPVPATAAQASQERELLARITDAHAVLADPVQRARYDHRSTGHQPRERPATGEGPSHEPTNGSASTRGSGVSWPVPPHGQPPIVVGPLRWEPPHQGSNPRGNHTEGVFG